MLTEHSADSNRGLVMGLRATAGRLAQPLAFGGVAAAAGMSAAFPILGAVLLVTILGSRRDLMALRSHPPSPEPAPPRGSP